MIICLGQVTGSLFFSQKYTPDSTFVLADCEDCTDAEELDGEENNSPETYCHCGNIKGLSAAINSESLNMPNNNQLPMQFACSPETPPPNGLI